MTKLRFSIAVLLAAFLLAGCGGSSSTAVTPPPPAPTPVAVDLMGSTDLMAGTFTVPAGGSQTIGDTTVSCTGTADCVIVVERNSATGQYSATSTGGTVMVAYNPPPPPDPVDQVALAAAKAAAEMAWEEARDRLTELAGKESANPTAYQRAMNAVADAKAASDASQLATTVADAEQYRDAARAANMVVMTQADMVVASYEAPALETAQMAAKSAADAAKMAYEAAKAALAAVEAIKADDMESYDMAAAQVAAAKAAYEAAMAASNAAAGTSVLADAQAQQEIAQGELTKANTANTDAMQYADMVQTAANNRMAAEREAEEQRQTDVAAARGMAMQSYMDADADATKAEEAADAAEAGSPGSAIAANARAAADAAREAANAAKAAHDAIMDDMTKERADALASEAATAAGTANTQYMTADQLNDAIQSVLQAAERQRMIDVDAARTLAMGSVSDANAAAEKAEAAADAAEAGSPDSAGAEAAREAATAARTAATAAQAALDAIMDDMTKAEADAEAAKAAAAAGTADGHYMTARVANDAIQAAITAANDKEQRKLDVAAARTLAMTSYVDANADAEKAEGAADAAEDGSPGSPAAIAARAAATAARTAATAAEAAHDAITDGMTKAQADEKAREAATEAGKANTQYMAARDANDDVQNIVAAQKEQQRQGDITATKAAVMAAETAKNDADMAAGAAEQARDDAQASYMKAMAARTDATMAKAEYEKAKTAAMEARAAANAAEAAYMAAQMAAEGIDDAMAEDAKTARMMAETEQGKAETAKGKADTQKMAAETAEMAAMDAAGTHVLRLFMAANGAHVMDLESTMDVDEKAGHVTDVGAAMAEAANATNNAGNNDGTDGATADTVASAMWPGDIAADPDATPVVEAVPGMLSVSVNPAGAGAITFELGATRAPDSTATPPITARIQTAMEIDRLGVFRGFDIWEDDGDATTTGDRARVIVFTNKTQDDPAVEESDAVEARSEADQEVTAAALGNVHSKARTITGVTWTPAGEAPLTGTLSCGDNNCAITLGEDGAVTSIAGYTFTGSREAKDAVEEVTVAGQAAANNDYLVFGLWLDESADGDTNTFGAFASGGTDYEVNVQSAVTGKATYTGKAAGAHHKTGDGVNWFDGDASLTANFGAADAGTISGEISNIRVAGGDPMSDSIYLGQADLTDGEATFNGAAFMGEPTAPGALTHDFDGTWSGSFFGATEDDPETTGAGNDESITAPLAAAGTFGVTRTMDMDTTDMDDDIVESFVGAFGAHKD